MAVLSRTPEEGHGPKDVSEAWAEHWLCILSGCLEIGFAGWVRLRPPDGAGAARPLPLPGRMPRPAVSGKRAVPDAAGVTRPVSPEGFRTFLGGQDKETVQIRRS